MSHRIALARSFASARTYVSGLLPLSCLLPAVALAQDTDGDTVSDAAEAVLGSDPNVDETLACVENDTHFSQLNTTGLTDGAYSVYAADINNDGLLDALSAAADDDNVSWYPGHGDGTFAAQQPIATAADGARFAFPADINVDGKIDVLVASYDDDTVACYKNNGGGSWTKKVIIQPVFPNPGANGARVVRAVDVNGDTDLDAVVVSELDNTLAWYENTGTTTWTKHVVDSGLTLAKTVYVANFEAAPDTDADLLATSADDDVVAWYANDGSGGFTKSVIWDRAGHGGTVGVLPSNTRPQLPLPNSASISKDGASQKLQQIARARTITHCMDHGRATTPSGVGGCAFRRRNE